MIKLRLNPLSSKTDHLEQKPNESILKSFERAKLKFPQINEHTEGFYKAFLYGHEIPREMWANIKPKDQSNLMFGIVPESGRNGQLIGQVVVLTAVIVTAVLTQGTSAAAWAPALAGFAASVAVNALIKLPGAATGNPNTGYGVEESQTYTITSQNNSLKKFGIVPRVYGTHRIFPNVAANPYTEFFADNNGELSQYFYAIYDFGLGPASITDLRIGNTPFSEFSEISYRLVDLNKPLVDEGSWDEQLNNSFELYKGDNNTEALGINLNSDSNVGAPADEYTAIRNAEPNTQNYEQEILIQMVCPQGLRTIDTAGNNLTRYIEVTCEFAVEGTDDWHSYNDQAFVKSFSSVGQVTEEGDIVSLYVTPKSSTSVRYLPNLDVETREITYNEALYYSQFRTGAFGTVPIPGAGETFFYDTYKYARGSTTFFSSKVINVDSVITYGGTNVGKIILREDLGGFFRYTLDQPFQQDIPLFSVLVWQRVVSPGGGPGGGPVLAYVILDSNDGATYLGNVPSGVLKVENLSGRFVISAAKQNPVFATIKFVPITQQSIKVRLTRVRSYGGATFQIFDDLTWQSLNTRFNTDPILTNKRHLFLEIRIKATDQLNGSITNLNGVVQSALDVYDPNTQTWSKELTNNPAWIFADILTGEVNKRAVNKTRLDTDSILEYAEFCDETPTPPPGATYTLPRFQSNFILDFKTTVKDLLNRVLGQCQASLNIINGKYGILIDKQKTIPVQVFTPRNSRNFASSRTYSDEPHALKVSYVDRTSDWQILEEVVYNDGFTAETAEKFEEVGTFGVTNNEQAWRFGRYAMAQSRLRKENITIEVDFENLVCTRGDFVKFQHDVMKVGGRPARISAITGNDVTIDDDFIIEVGKNYGYTFRNYLGVYSGTLSNIGVDTATLSGPELPQVGDLFIWGEVDKVTIDCIVKETSPSSDLSATLVLVEKADEIYLAESTSTLPDYSPQLSRSVDDVNSAPGEVQSLEVVANTFDCNGTNYIYQVELQWQAPTINVADTYEIYVQTTGEYQLADVVKGTSYVYEVDQNDLGFEHNFKVLALSASGDKLTLGEVGLVSATPVRKSTPPSNVDALYINVLNETLQLTWPLISDCDVLEYEIRYSPNTNATWEQTNLLQTVDRKTNQVSFQARTGIYYVKARDFNGNLSFIPAGAITSIPDLVDLNVVSETNDFPTLAGAKDRVTTFSSELVLLESVSTPPNIEFFSEGFYYYQNLLTLDDIYIVRLQSLIEAEGFTPNDLMVNWTPLSAVTTLATAGTSDWYVETQYRSTDQLNVMANWATLDVIDPLSEGIQEKFTDWRSFTIGDFSGRIFQFRLRLVSLNPSVSPRVFEGKIKADMPDRQVSDNNIVADINGETIAFNPAFFGPTPAPAIAISIDDAQSGDRYEFTSKNLQGFTIQFYDSGNNKVSRQFDYIAKGYGRKTAQII